MVTPLTCPNPDILCNECSIIHKCVPVPIKVSESESKVKVERKKSVKNKRKKIPDWLKDCTPAVRRSLGY